MSTRAATIRRHVRPDGVADPGARPGHGTAVRASEARRGEAELALYRLLEEVVPDQVLPCGRDPPPERAPVIRLRRHRRRR